MKVKLMVDKILKKLKFWLLKKLFTDSEKELIARAIYDRQQYISKAVIEEKTLDYYNNMKDFADLDEIKQVFSGNDWA
jgi:hypothetical protein